MDETKTTPEQNQEGQENVDGSQAVVNALNETKGAIAKTVYQSIDYEAIFNALNQADKYQEFNKYVADYEERYKVAVEKNEPFTEKPRLWHEFLDITTVTNDSIGIMFDQLVGMIVEVSIAAAQSINSCVYDVLIVPQLQNVQNFCEQVAASIGAITRRLNSLEQEYDEED